MKQIRKWSRIIHRDFGYLFFGITVIYGLSGIALNHLKDWNPNYSVEVVEFNTTRNLKKGPELETNIKKLVNDIVSDDEYRKHYYPGNEQIKIFLSGGSSIVANINTGDGYAELLKKRPLFYHVNFLHYNPNTWWTWVSDLFAGALIVFALTGLVMVKGSKGITGRGAWLTALGIIIPLLFIFFS